MVVCVYYIEPSAVKSVQVTVHKSGMCVDMSNFAACVQWEYMAYRYSISGIHKYGIIFVLTVVSSIANMDLDFVRQGTKVLALTIDYVSSLVHKDMLSIPKVLSRS